MQQYQRCPDCGRQTKPTAQFCSNCGRQLSQGTIRLGAGPRLQISVGGQLPYDVSLSGSPITIGREPNNTIVVPYSEASRHHAQIVPHAGGYAVADLNSSNGTFLQGQRIPPNQAVPLGDGNVILIGDQWGNAIKVTYLATGLPSPPGTSKIGPFPLDNRPRLVIGREGCDINLSHPGVSRRHAELVRVGAAHQIRDLGSTNGTFVNGRLAQRAALQNGDQLQFGPYKLIYTVTALEGESSVGSIRLDGVQLYKAYPLSDKPRLARGNRTVAQWLEDLLMWLPQRFSQKTPLKVVLNSISLTVMPREFIALVGGSGAGKSTLMDALNGFRRAQGGRVLVNRDDLYQNYDLYRTNMGYVPQQDIIHTGLTVRRALRYAALLRLPPDTQEHVIEARIKAVLQQVDMLPQIDQQIASLSGGQCKRVSIASELISEPSLFFLDEPTSGLDPGLDKRMMYTLNKMADGGKTIVLTTHATNNIIGQCDQVCFLSFGRLVYYGPPEQAIHFFQAADFADIYSKLDTPQTAEQYERAYKQSADYQQYVVSRQQSVPGLSPAGGRMGKAKAAQPNINFNALAQQAKAKLGPLKFDFGTIARQFRILARRYVDLIFNDAFSLFTLLAVMPIIGVLLLLIANAKSLVGDRASKIDQILQDQGYYNIASEAQKLLLMLALSVILLGVFAAAYEIIKEKPIYRRERMVNLGIPAYIFSKIGVLLGFGLIQCLTLLVVISSKVDFPSEGVLLPAPLEMYITLVLALLAGIGMGLLISALVKTENTVIYLVLVVLFVQIIFSGALFELPDAASPLSAITPTRWAMEGLGASVDMGRLNDLNKSYIEEVEVNGQEMDIDSTVDAPMDFTINYAADFEHLIGTWVLQLLFTVVSLGLAGWVLKGQDVRA